MEIKILLFHTLFMGTKIIGTQQLPLICSFTFCGFSCLPSEWKTPEINKKFLNAHCSEQHDEISTIPLHPAHKVTPPLSRVTTLNTLPDSQSLSSCPAYLVNCHRYHSACAQVRLASLNTDPRAQSNDVVNLDIPK